MVRVLDASCVAWSAVSTTNGGVRLNDLANEIHAKTTNGGVKGTGIDPSVFDGSAVNGGVDLDLRAGEFVVILGPAVIQFLEIFGSTQP